MTKKKPRPLTRIELLRFPEAGQVPYVRQFLADREYKINPDSSITNKEGYVVPVDHVFADLHDTHSADYYTFIKDLEKGEWKPLRITDKSLEMALRLIVDRARGEDLARIRAATAYDPSVGDSAIKQFVKAVTGEESPLVVSALKHWVKNIKRRMAGKEVTFQLFPVIVGKQEGGKSTAFKKLVSPIEWYVMSLNSVAQLADERNYKALSERFVCFIDEMADADRTEAAILKYVITADTYTARVMYTNIRATYKAAASFMGTSNKSVTSIIYDTSGMRRWLEIKALDQLDWAAINSINFSEVWRSVDEDADYLAAVKPALKEHQEEIRPKTAAEEFVEDMGITPGEPGNPDHKVTNGTLFANYAAWAVAVGKKFNLDSRHLGRHLEDLGFETWKSGGARGRWVKAPSVFEKKGADVSWATNGKDELAAVGAQSNDPVWLKNPPPNGRRRGG